MPNSQLQPEHTNPQVTANDQRRWAAELERDRLAATMMANPSLPYPGPGAVAASAGKMGVSGDMLDDGSLKGKTASVAADAAIAYVTGPKGWIDFAWKHKEVVAIVLGLALLLSAMQWLPLLVFTIRISDVDCAWEMGREVAKTVWSGVIDYLFK